MRTRTLLEKPLIAKMQQDIARPSYFAREKNGSKRSVLSHVAEMPFCSVVVCPSSWLSWSRPRLVDRNEKKVCYPHSAFASQEPALSCVGNTTLLKLLWLSLSIDLLTITVAQLAVFLSSYAFFYDISLKKEDLLEQMVSHCKHGQLLFTFAEAISACPPVHHVLPAFSAIDKCYNSLSACCNPLTWGHIAQFVKHLSLPLFTEDKFETIKRYAELKDDAVLVTKVAFRSFIVRLYTKPSLQDIDANFPSCCFDFGDEEPQPGTLSLLTFCRLMKRYGLDEFVR